MRTDCVSVYILEITFKPGKEQLLTIFYLRVCEASKHWSFVSLHSLLMKKEEFTIKLFFILLEQFITRQSDLARETQIEKMLFWFTEFLFLPLCSVVFYRYSKSNVLCRSGWDGITALMWIKNRPFFLFCPDLWFDCQFSLPNNFIGTRWDTVLQNL